MQRAYLSCLYRGLVSIPPLFFFEVLRVRAIFAKLKSEDHKVTGSKPVSVRILLSVDFPVSGVVRAKPQKVGLWCKCKIARWSVSKTFPMEVRVRELLFGSRLFVRTERFSTSYSPVTMRAVS